MENNTKSHESRGRTDVGQGTWGHTKPSNLDPEMFAHALVAVWFLLLDVMNGKKTPNSHESKGRTDVGQGTWGQVCLTRISSPLTLVGFLVDFI